MTSRGAREAVGAASGLRDDIGNRPRVDGLCVRGLVEARSGDTALARRFWERTLAECGSDARDVASEASCRLARLARESSDLPEAERLLAMAEAAAKQSRDSLRRAFCHLERGHLAVATGRSPRPQLRAVEAMRCLFDAEPESEISRACGELEALEGSERRREIDDG